MELGVLNHPTLVTLTSELSTQRLRFDARAVRVERQRGKETDFSPSNSVSLVFIIPPMFCTNLLLFSPPVNGAWGSVVVKALRYKSEGPGIDSRCRRDFFRGI
jgi:hypothetical protein